MNARKGQYPPWRRLSEQTTEGIELSEGNIADVQDSSKHHDILQANDNREEATRKSATIKYLSRVSPVLQSQLNDQNKVGAINTNDQPII